MKIFFFSLCFVLKKITSYHVTCSTQSPNLKADVMLKIWSCGKINGKRRMRNCTDLTKKTTQIICLRKVWRSRLLKIWLLDMERKIRMSLEENSERKTRQRCNSRTNGVDTFFEWKWKFFVAKVFFYIFFADEVFILGIVEFNKLSNESKRFFFWRGLSKKEKILQQHIVQKRQIFFCDSFSIRKHNFLLFFLFLWFDFVIFLQ